MLTSVPLSAIRLAKLSSRVHHWASDAALCKLSERLMNALQIVKAAEASYRSCVEDDSQCVNACDAAERVVLGEMEALDFERARNFISSVSRLVVSELGALKNIKAGLNRFLKPFSSSASPVRPQSSQAPPNSNSTSNTTSNSNAKTKGGDMHAAECRGGESMNRLQGPDPVILAEAESSGLPMELARSREELVHLWKMGSSVQQFLSALKKALEGFAAATETFSSKLGSSLVSAGYPVPDKGQMATVPGSLCVTIVKAEGPRCLQAWSSVVSTILSQIRLSKAALKHFNGVLESKLNSAVLTDIERGLKKNKDSSDAAWKRACDSSRQVGKAEAKLKSAKTEMEKAAEKVEILRVESEKQAEKQGGITQEEEGSQEQSRPMWRALGHVMSSFGSSSERLELAKHAHKKAKGAVEEAAKVCREAEREAKDAREAYKNYAEEAAASFKADREESEEVGATAMSVVANALHDSVVSREINLDEARKEIEKIEREGVEDDAIHWGKKSERKIRKKAESWVTGAGSGSGSGSGATSVATSLDPYDLQLELKTSCAVVYALLKDLLGYEPENVTLCKLTEGQDFEASTVSAIVQAISDEECARRGGSTLKDKEQRDFERDFKDFFADAAGGGAVEGAGGPAEASSASAQSAEATQAPEVVVTAASAASAHFPNVIESYSCAYWPQKKDESTLPSPLLHGRMFVTAGAIYFVGWGKFKMCINVERIAAVKKDTTALGAVDNALVIEDLDGKSYFFGSFVYREDCMQLIERVRSVKGALIEGGFVEPTAAEGDAQDNLADGEVSSDKGGGEEDEVEMGSGDESSGNSSGRAFRNEGSVDDEGTEDVEGRGQLTNIVPKDADQKVKDMVEILSDTLHGTSSAAAFFKAFWSTPSGNGKPSFYELWLSKCGSQNVEVSPWVASSAGHLHEFSGERFKYRRTAKFLHKRTTHLWMGPPMALVTQTQYCRVDKDGRCVVAMTGDTKGIPYVDCFAV